MEQDQESINNQKEFREILANNGITQAQAATLINIETSRKISNRTIRAWLANPNAVSARVCPLWAVVALKKAILNR
jgi:hypothetical protein